MILISKARTRLLPPLPVVILSAENTTISPVDITVRVKNIKYEFKKKETKKGSSKREKEKIKSRG